MTEEALRVANEAKEAAEELRDKVHTNDNRLTRVEQKIDDHIDGCEVRYEAQDKKLDRITDLLLWLIKGGLIVSAALAGWNIADKFQLLP